MPFLYTTFQNYVWTVFVRKKKTSSSSLHKPAIIDGIYFFLQVGKGEQFSSHVFW